MTEKKDIIQNPDGSVRINSSALKTKRFNTATMKSFVQKAQRSSKSIYILCDCSDSMSGTRIQQLRDVVKQLIGRPGLSFIRFSNKVERVENPAQVTTFGGTRMWSALDFAYTERADRILLMTDGEPTDKDKQQILDIVQASHPTIPIDTIGIHGGRSASWGYDPEFLRKLSEITGGTFREVEDARIDELLQTTEEILQIEHKKSGTLPPGSGGGAIQL